MVAYFIETGVGCTGLFVITIAIDSTCGQAFGLLLDEVRTLKVQSTEIYRTCVVVIAPGATRAGATFAENFVLATVVVLRAGVQSADITIIAFSVIETTLASRFWRKYTTIIRVT